MGKKLLGVLLITMLIVTSVFTNMIGIVAIYVLTKLFIAPVIFSFVMGYFTIKLEKKLKRKFLY